MIEIYDSCIGCAKCIPVCPFGALEMKNKKAVVNEKCTLCGACVEVCPVNAIEVRRKEVSHDLSAYKGVWVFAELMSDGVKENPPKKIRRVTFELLSQGRKLADELGEELSAVVLCDKAQDFAKELSKYKADKVYLIEKNSLAHYDTDIFSTCMCALISKYKPSIVLYPSTYVGRDLAPKIASELYVGLTADCTGLSIKDENLLQTRPAFGGNIMADILSPNARPQMATVRPNVLKVSEPDISFETQIIKEDLIIDENISRVKVLERKIDPKHTAENIANAEIIVSGGRGTKDKKGFKMLKELADTLGASVGASRAAVDMGLKPKSNQVGQSGTTVSPKLYFACGISGAVQHIVGMNNSDVIIAVNKDVNAPIFDVCKFGLVGDLHQIVPKLTENLKKIK